MYIYLFIYACVCVCDIAYIHNSVIRYQLAQARTALVESHLLLVCLGIELRALPTPGRDQYRRHRKAYYVIAKAGCEDMYMACQNIARARPDTYQLIRVADARR